jgi:HEAT repeat protein
MKQWPKGFIHFLVISVYLCSVEGSVRAASTVEFEAALEKIRAYDYGQSREPLSVVSDMVHTVSDAPQSSVFAAKIAAMLESSVTYACKDFLCRQLAVIGTDDQAESLGKLLVDEKYSDMARYALARIDGSKSSEVMRTALAKTSGKIKVGIINSLGAIGENQAIPELSAMVYDRDPAIASASVVALGKITSSDAGQALDKAIAKTDGPLLDEIYDAYMSYAYNLVKQNKKKRALAIYQKTYSQSKAVSIRRIALRGLVMASGPESADIILNVLKDKDSAMHVTAISLLNEVPGKAITESVAKLLSTLPPDSQMQFLSTLANRGDPAVLPHVRKAAESSESAVRIAALKALEKLGDRTTVGFLAKTASTTKGAEQEAARNSLYAMSGPGIDKEIVQVIPKANAKSKVELIRAIEQRNSAGASKTLLKTAKDPDATVRRESIKSLKTIATPDDLPALVTLLINAENEPDRSQAERTVAAVADKISDRNRQAEAVLAAFDSTGDTKIRCSLLSVLGKIANDPAFDVLVKTLSDKEQRVQMTAIRALSNWPDAKPLPKLRKIAETSDSDRQRVLALQGFIRLVGIATDRSNEETLTLYRAAIDLAPGDAEKKRVLSGLAKIKTTNSLLLAAEFLATPSLNTEAAVAVASIACPQNDQDKGLRGPQVKSVLEKAIEQIEEGQVRQKIEDHLKSVSDDEEGFAPLFNGKDFTGWYGDIEEGWRVEDGIIICEGNTIWSEKEFDDFILRFDFKLSPGANNGLGIRLPRAGFAAYDCMEIQINDDTHERWKDLNPYQQHGAVYGISGVKPGHLNPVGQWNTQEVVAHGRQITVALNGVTITDVDIDEASKFGCLDGLDYLHHPGLERTRGCLCFQGHAGLEGNRVDFRNVRIKEIKNPRPPKPENAGFDIIFNGNDLSGWRQPAEGWDVDNRSLIGEQGNLYTEKEYADFVFRFQFKLSAGGNSGVGIRMPASGEDPLEIQILDDTAEKHRDLKPWQYHGSLYGIVPAKRGHLKPVGQWNYEEIIAKGNSLVVNLNGTKILDVDLDKVKPENREDHPGLKRKKGVIGFLGHGSRVEYCNIRIKPL